MEADTGILDFDARNPEHIKALEDVLDIHRIEMLAFSNFLQKYPDS